MSADHTADANIDGLEWDPVYLHSRREAWFVFCVWLCAMLWSLPCCYNLGYPAEFDPQSFTTIAGMPAWVFWGIGLPWLIADVVTIWFCFRLLRVESLEPDDAVAGD